MPVDIYFQQKPATSYDDDGKVSSLLSGEAARAARGTSRALTGVRVRETRYLACRAAVWGPRELLYSLLLQG